jgi:hypothetical protein
MFSYNEDYRSGQLSIDDMINNAKAKEAETFLDKYKIKHGDLKLIYGEVSC